MITTIPTTNNSLEVNVAQNKIQKIWREKKSLQQIPLGSGMRQIDLEEIQEFMRSMIQGISVENRNMLAIINIKRFQSTPMGKTILDSTNTKWSRSQIKAQLDTYASRYGYIYSKSDTPEVRKLNAAFKVKCIIEALVDIPKGHWDTSMGRWTMVFETQDILDKVNDYDAHLGLMYTNALLYLCGKKSEYHSTTWFRLLSPPYKKKK